MTRFTLRHSCALGALATAALSATPALAQAEVETAGAATQNENRIVVTGSYIRGTPEDAALPVDVFTADAAVFILRRGSGGLDFCLGQGRGCRKRRSGERAQRATVA